MQGYINIIDNLLIPPGLRVAGAAEPVASTGQPALAPNAATEGRRPSTVASAG